jgi:hypothetical protein
MDKRPGNGGGKTSATTGLELSFAIHTSAALEIRAVTAAEIEAKQRDEEGQDLNVDGNARSLRRTPESIATPCSVKA